MVNRIASVEVAELILRVPGPAHKHWLPKYVWADKKPLGAKRKTTPRINPGMADEEPRNLRCLDRQNFKS
jgi:hypothetical protein